jgi:predicted dehydrogenase
MVGDLEEILADPTIEAVIVAAAPSLRPAQLRRALQSERHVLCVHPADQGPDLAYEALMIQGDTGRVLLPLLPEGLHPAIVHLAKLAGTTAAAEGAVWLLEIERSSIEQVLLEADGPGHRPGLPTWDMLRRIGGEIAEVSAFAAGEEIEADQPLLVAGRFQQGGLFAVTLLPQQSEPRLRLSLAAGYKRLELTFPQGWPGPSHLVWQDDDGRGQQESWDSWNPWPEVVVVFESAVKQLRLRSGEAGRSAKALAWTDEVRCLELDDAARRSVSRRRSSTLEYQTATEEASFKGTMTLVGCSLIWASLVLLILSVWVPWMGWLIAPLLVLFLALQMLRWAVPARTERTAAEAGQALHKMDV